MARLHIQSDGTWPNTFFTVDDKLLDDVIRLEVLAEGRSDREDCTFPRVLVRLTLLAEDIQIDTENYEATQDT